MSAGGEVGFTVKELLIDLRQDVRAIDAKLDAKADRERVHDLAGRVGALELRVPAADVVLAEFRMLQQDVHWLKRAYWVAAGAITGVQLTFGALVAYLQLS